MKIRVRAQVAAILGVPILLLAVIAAIVSAQLGAVERSQKTVVTMAGLGQAAHDIVLQEYLHRFVTRGAVLTLKPINFVLVARAGDAMAAISRSCARPAQTFAALRNSSRLRSRSQS